MRNNVRRKLSVIHYNRLTAARTKLKNIPRKRSERVKTIREAIAHGKECLAELQARGRNLKHFARVENTLR